MRMTDQGEEVKVNELYVIQAVSFADCEYRVTEMISKEVRGEFDVLTETRARYTEIFLSDDESENVFYKVKVDFQTVDERGKEKHSKSEFLVQGSSVDSAKRNVDSVMGDMTSYRILGVQETAIVDFVDAQTAQV